MNRRHPVRVRFFNTYDPVVPLFETMLPVMRASGMDANAVVADFAYRAVGPEAAHREYIHLPRIAKRNNRVVALAYWLRAPFRLLVKSPDIAIFLTQPPLFYILGGILARACRIRYIVHIMDMYPHFLVRARVLSEKGILFRLLRALAASVLRSADAVIVIGRCARSLVEALGVPPQRIHVIPNWAPEDLHPVEAKQNEFITKHGIQDRFIVMYSGNMGMAHRFETLLQIVREFEQSHPRVLFVFIGRGSKRGHIEAATAGLKNVLLLDYQPRSQLSQSLSAGHVHFVSLTPGFEGISVPSKLYGIMACGRPVIFEGPRESEIAHVLAEAECGIHVDPDDAVALREAILYYYRDTEAVFRHGHQGRTYYHSHYAPGVGSRRYWAVVSQVAVKVGEGRA